MTPLWQLGAGGLAACGGWLATRAAGGAAPRVERWLLLDLAIPLAIFALASCLTARPLFAGLLVLGAGAGFAYAERAKRATLAEPIVFTDVFQTADIFRHPELAAPFPNRLPILLALLVTLGGFAALFRSEPPLALAISPLAAVAACLLLLILAGWLLSGPANAALARQLRGAGMNGEPFADAARFGVLATLIGYGLIARAERAARCAAVAPADPAPAPAVSSRPAYRPPVLLVQCESFFDARRLGAYVVPELLPNFDRLCADSRQWGRLAVPCWGANTVRSEFAVLTGLAEEALGLDRFNPYHRFARRPIASLATQMRARGYRTLCLHPFDRRFYGRDRVLPQLGFDAFLGEESFVGAPRVNGFVADSAIAEVVERLIAEQRGAVFVFVITLENHGPWSTGPLAAGPCLAPGVPLPPGEAAAFERYLASLRNSDALLGALARDPAGDGRLLGFYGDHRPSLSLTGGRDRDNSSDYLIWQAGAAANAARRQDLAARDLSAALLAAHDTMLGLR